MLLKRKLHKQNGSEERLSDAIRGCLFGGAAGDALGYPVEFLQEGSIFRKYGPKGIKAYEADAYSGVAQISDDTQMTLFTANGLLVWDTEKAGKNEPPRSWVMMAYQDWFKTQMTTFREVNRHERLTEDGGSSWLLDVPELFSRRAPGNTCPSALADGTEYADYVKAARNHSKGCGGIMRVAPLALNGKPADIKALDLEGAQLAAITHGHSLGYMPAAVLTHVISRIVFPEGAEPVTGEEALTSAETLTGEESPAGQEQSLKNKTMSLKEIVLEARDTAAEIFKDDEHLPELLDIVDRAVRLSENDLDDLDNIHQLGEGWVAEETLGIALYCALKYQDDFSAGLIAAVNHNGDSDSTGAVTGNILGALLGYSAIEEKWLKDLELADVIAELADDLYKNCLWEMNGRSQPAELQPYCDPEWSEKYVRMHRPGV